MMVVILDKTPLSHMGCLPTTRDKSENSEVSFHSCMVVTITMG